MGAKLKDLIEQELHNGITQFNLARLIGVSNGTIWKHINGISTPTVETYAKYAAYFKMSLRQLIAMDSPGDKESPSEWAHLSSDEEILLSRYREIKKFKQHGVVLDYTKFFLDRLYDKATEPNNVDQQGES